MSDPNTKWLRARFYTDSEDWRPVTWPPAGPCWCTGYADHGSCIVAYVRSSRQLMKQWPEATHIELEHCRKPEFSERFPKPEWWQDPGANASGGEE